MRRPTKLLGILLVVGALVSTAAPAAAATAPLNISASGATGSGTFTPGTPCATGGAGDAWNFTYTAPAAMLTATLPAAVALALDVHADPGASTGYLGPNSTVTLSNPRGAIVLQLASGTCASPALVLSAGSVSGPGSWGGPGAITGSGSYRDITGSGTFVVSFARLDAASITNAFVLNLAGTVTVLQPALRIANATASWASPADFLNRKLTVTYAVRNVGPGDAFNVALNGVTPLNSGVTANFSGPMPLGNLAAGATRTVAVKYNLARSNTSPCLAQYLRCTVKAQLDFGYGDALDVPAAQTLTATAVALP